MQPSRNKAGVPGRAAAAACGLAVAGALLLSPAAWAALIEVPIPDPGPHAASRSWQDHTRQLRRVAADFRHGPLGEAAIGVARVGNFGPRSAYLSSGESDAGLYAAIDAPFGAMESASALGPDSETEFWTLLLVGAGLVAYQIRRKSRVGFIRVRPL
jgi:hypothetical protein